MRYKVHRVEVSRDTMQERLEQLLNRLDGEVVGVVPNVRQTFQLMGATSRVDFVLVVEKVR